MNPELTWIGRFKEGDLVSMAAYRQHSDSLSPGLVTDIIERPYEYEGNSEWALLAETTKSLSGPRVQVLHPDGTLKLWRPEELVTYKG